MLIVICSVYSQWLDAETGVQFERRNVGGLFVGVAEVDEEVAESFKNRPGFEVLGAETFTALVTPPVTPEPNTGDPLTDGAAKVAETPNGKKTATPPGPVATNTPTQTTSAPPPPPPSN